jgi:hypothetical protein
MSDLFASIGGTISLLHATFSLMMIYISQHIFYVSLINELFKTKIENKMFKHAISDLWSIRLFFAERFRLKFCCKKFSGQKFETIDKIYRRGKKKIRENFEAVQFIKKL